MNWNDILNIEQGILGILVNGISGLTHAGAIAITKAVSKQLEKRKTKSFLKKTIPNQFDKKLLKELKSISIHPAQFKSGYKNFFNDETFRKMLLNWMFSIRIEEKNKSFALLQEYSEKKISKEQSEPILLFITNVYLQTIANDPVLSSIIHRADHSKIIDAIQSEGFRIRLEIDDISIKLNEVLSKLDVITFSKTHDDAIIKNVREYSQSVINSISIQIPIIGYIEKNEIEYTLNLAIERKNVLILGEAGSGKTGVLTKIGSVLLEKNESVLFISADRIAAQVDSKCTIEDLSKSIAIAPDRNIIEIIDILQSKSERVWLLIDQLDEVAGHAVGAAIYELINAYSKRKKVHIISACRSYEAMYSSEFSSLTLDSLYIGDLSPEDTSNYIEKIGIEPTNDLCTFCSNLLNLSLLAFIKESNEHSPKISSEISLWFYYRNEIEKRVSGSLNKIPKYAKDSLLSRTNSFVAANDKIADKLASFGLLIRISANLYRFKHERIRDYFIAYDFIVLKEKGIVELLNEIQPVKSRNIIPWMIKIADFEKPEILDFVLKDVFNDKTFNNGFVFKSILNSFSSISQPSASLASAVYKIYNKIDWDKVHYSYKYLSSSWANAFWEAGVFQADNEFQSDLFKSIERSYDKEIFDWFISIDNPKYFGHLLDFMSRINKERYLQIKHKFIGWLSNSDFAPFNLLKDIINRYVDFGDSNTAITILSKSVEPITKNYKYDKRPHLQPRIHEFHMLDHYVERPYKKIPWKINEHQLINIAENALKEMLLLAGNINSNIIYDYEYWANPEFFISSKKDARQDWCFWYGFLYISVNQLIHSKNNNLLIQWIRNNCSSEDKIIQRFAIHFYGKLDEMDEQIETILFQNGYLKNPENIPESIKLLGRYLKNKNEEKFESLLIQLNKAITKLPKGINITSINSPKKLQKWASWYLLSKNIDSILQNTPINNVARFIFCSKDKYNNDYEKYPLSKLLLISKILINNPFQTNSKGTLIFLGGGSEQVNDVAEEYENLQNLKDYFDDEKLINRIGELINESKKHRIDLSSEPFGYVLLRSCNYQIDKYKRMPVISIVSAYRHCINDNSWVAPAMRSEFAGFLSQIVKTKTQSYSLKSNKKIENCLKKLILCTDEGIIKPFGGYALNMGNFPPSTASTALNGYINYLYLTRIDSNLSVSEHILNVYQKLDLSKKYELDKNENLLLDCFELGRNGKNDIVIVFGRWYSQLFVLYPLFAISITSIIFEKHKDLIEIFFDSVHKSSASILFYQFFKPYYEYYIKEKNSVTTGIIFDMAWAYMHNIENYEKEDNLLSLLFKDSDDQIWTEFISSACSIYDQNNGQTKHWQKIIEIWEKVNIQIGDTRNPKYSSFSRVFENKYSNSDEKSVLRIPCSINDYPEFIESVFTSSKCFDVMIEYLSNQFIGNEVKVIELLSNILKNDKGHLDTFAIKRDASKRLLQKALREGGKTRELAIELIEQNEMESDYSLAGLISI